MPEMTPELVPLPLESSTRTATSVTFFARPFGEMDLLALAKAYQDAAGFHLKKPTKLDT